MLLYCGERTSGPAWSRVYSSGVSSGSGRSSSMARKHSRPLVVRLVNWREADGGHPHYSQPTPDSDVWEEAQVFWPFLHKVQAPQQGSTGAYSLCPADVSRISQLVPRFTFKRIDAVYIND